MAEFCESFMTPTTIRWTPPPRAYPPLPSAGGDRDLVLSLHETLAAYISVYYIGIIVSIIVFLFVKFIKPAGPVKPKA